MHRMSKKVSITMNFIDFVLFSKRSDQCVHCFSHLVRAIWVRLEADLDQPVGVGRLLGLHPVLHHLPIYRRGNYGWVFGNHRGLSRHGLLLTACRADLLEASHPNAILLQLLMIKKKLW